MSEQKRRSVILSREPTARWRRRRLWSVNKSSEDGRNNLWSLADEASDEGETGVCLTERRSGNPEPRANSSLAKKETLVGISRPRS